MPNKARGSKWSLLVVRGADRHVKQFRVSKRSVVAAPAAAILAVSGCIAGLQIRSAYQLHLAKETIDGQSAVFADTVRANEDRTAELEREIEMLKRQAADLQSQLSDMRELESKLSQFTAEYDGTVRPDDREGGSPPPAAEESYPADESMRAMLLNSSGSAPDFRAISQMVDTMEQTMADSLRKERERRARLNAIPSGWPTASHTLTSGFGYRSDPFTGKSAFHAGIDIGGKPGDPVFAAADGIVAEIGTDAAKGNYIVVSHQNNLQSAYYHLQRILVKRNEPIDRGEKIGLMGSSGRSTGAHLHFEILQRDEPVNPFQYLRLVKED